MQNKHCKFNTNPLWFADWQFRSCFKDTHVHTVCLCYLICVGWICLRLLSVAGFALSHVMLHFVEKEAWKLKMSWLFTSEISCVCKENKTVICKSLRADLILTHTTLFFFSCVKVELSCKVSCHGPLNTSGTTGLCFDLLSRFISFWNFVIYFQEMVRSFPPGHTVCVSEQWTWTVCWSRYL